MILEVFARVLGDAGLGEVGRDIVAGSQPPGVAYGIFPFPSTEPSELPELRRTDFRVVCRANRIGDAWTKAEQARAALMLRQHDDDEAHVYACDPVGEPFRIEGGSDALVAVNFESSWIDGPAWRAGL